MRDGAGVATTERRFDAAFRAEFADLLVWRRDVRRFRADPVSELNSRRAFPACRIFALGRKLPTDPLRARGRRGPPRRGAGEFRDRQPRSARRLPRPAGGALRTAEARRPERGAGSLRRVLRRTDKEGHGLGARTMPETRRYSAVCALYTFWLAARAYGLGVGWVSILDPASSPRRSTCRRTGAFIGYLCIGWPEEEHATRNSSGPGGRRAPLIRCCDGEQGDAHAWRARRAS